MTTYWVYVIYLTLVFAAFTHYRRLILADVGIIYTEYWIALIKAMIFAKVMMVGDALKLGHSFSQQPLIVPTLVKTVFFTLLVSVFTLIEHGLRGGWNGTGFLQGMVGLLDKGSSEIVANTMVVFVAFIPFFAFRELGRALGAENNMMALFFKKRGER